MKGPCLCGDPACWHCGSGYDEPGEDDLVLAEFLKPGGETEKKVEMKYGDLPDTYEWCEVAGNCDVPAFQGTPIAMMPVPTVHLNGTSGEELMEQFRKVTDALRNAVAVLTENFPNARDYYVQEDPNAFTKAKDEWEAARGTLIEMREKFFATAIYIADQLPTKKK
jgi:hypothetical protein